MTDQQPPQPNLQPIRQPRPKRRIEPWAIGPLLFFVILIAGHLLLIAQMRKSDVSTVEPDAYERASHYDADQAAIARFERLGLRLECTPLGEGAVSCAVTGANGVAIEAVQLEFYRADDADLDQAIVWEDPATPIDLALPRTGLWRVTLIGEVAGEAVRTAVRLRL